MSLDVDCEIFESIISFIDEDEKIEEVVETGMLPYYLAKCKRKGVTDVMVNYIPVTPAQWLTVQMLGF